MDLLISLEGKSGSTVEMDFSQNHEKFHQLREKGILHLHSQAPHRTLLKGTLGVLIKIRGFLVKTQFTF